MLRIARQPSLIVNFYFAGILIEAQAGDSVAAALLAAGHGVFRITPVSGAARGPVCMMGVCFDCLVQIDGLGNQQACMREVRDGMRVEPQDGAFDALPARPVEETP
jgi:predicted molibdopterin-dependent oxidoreductase YjgC